MNYEGHLKLVLSLAYLYTVIYLGIDLCPEKNLVLFGRTRPRLLLPLSRRLLGRHEGRRLGWAQIVALDQVCLRRGGRPLHSILSLRCPDVLNSNSPFIALRASTLILSRF